MPVLLMRLAGPMQSWGTQSRFLHRDTGREPSKSGVIGVLCAALGRPRDAALDDLAKLAMGVRVDREGRIARDYQTAADVARADGTSPDAVVSQRYYLADADFLVGLEGDGDLLNALDLALATPYWPLYLGRKAFVPGWPVWIGPGRLREGDLRSTLAAYPWRPRDRREKPPERLRLVLETEPADGEMRHDLPLSFAARRFTLRYVKTEFCPTPGRG